MLTLQTSHGISVLLATAFSLLLHFSFSGFNNSMRSYLINFTLFPLCLMALTLFLPQDFLQTLSYFFIIAGFILALYKLPTRLHFIFNKFRAIEKTEKWILFFLGIYLLSFFMGATIFKDSGSIQDALVYHLEGPKEWALYLNGAKFNTNNPISFTTSYYDYFYYFIFLLLKPLFLNFTTLASTQYEFLSYTVLLNAQIFTSFIALVYVPYLIIKLSSKLGLYKYLAVVFIYGLRLITWSWILPKNDIFPFLCFLVSIELFYANYILTKENKRLFPLALAALIVGTGTASKLTNAYVVIYSLLFLYSFYFKEVKNYMKSIGSPKVIIIVSIGMLCGASIFLLRNYLNTGNPFFPIDKFGFNNIYISTYAHRPQLYYTPINWMDTLYKIKIHIIDQPQLFLILIISFFYKNRSLSVFYILMVAYMSKLNGVMFTFRMVNIYLVLALILFIQLILNLKNQKWFNSTPKYSYTFIIFLLIFSSFQPEKLIKYPFTYFGQPTGLLIQDKVDYWPIILETNMQNRQNKKYVFSPKEEIFPYFSRFPFISQYDSVPQYRYDYYEKN